MHSKGTPLPAQGKPAPVGFHGLVVRDTPACRELTMNALIVPMSPRGAPPHRGIDSAEKKRVFVPDGSPPQAGKGPVRCPKREA
jgi:hypothetical protein